MRASPAFSRRVSTEERALASRRCAAGAGRAVEASSSETGSEPDDSEADETTRALSIPFLKRAAGDGENAAAAPDSLVLTSGKRRRVGKSANSKPTSAAATAAARASHRNRETKRSARGPPKRVTSPREEAATGLCATSASATGASGSSESGTGAGTKRSCSFERGF